MPWATWGDLRITCLLVNQTPTSQRLRPLQGMPDASSITLIRIGPRGAAGERSLLPHFQVCFCSINSSASSMSEMCHEETHAPQQITALFNHFVGAGEEYRRHNDIKRLCSLQIDHQFVLGRLFDRQVGWLRSLENLVDEARSTPI